MLRLVRYSKDNHFSIWQQFVRENGHLFHDIRWLDIIQSSYKFQSYYHLIYDSDELLGIAPFFQIAKHKLLSLPFISFAGFCFKNNSEIDEEKIIENILKETDFGNFELEIRRKRNYVEDLNEKDVDKLNKYVTMIKNLDSDIDSVFKKFDKKQRNMIRKAEQEPFEMLDCDVDSFYRIYLKATNDLGTPGHKKEFFRKIIDLFGDNVRLKLLKREKIEVGVMFEIDYFRTRYDLWAFSLKEFFQYKPNVFLYWETLKDAISKGIEFYDFGRSTTGGGTYNFKRNWGAEPVFLEYFKIKKTKGGITREYLSPHSGGKLPILWSKIPHFITNFAGPILRKKIV